MPFMQADYIIGCVLAVVAGIIVYISLHELLPAAHKYSLEHIIAIEVISGMAVTIVSLIMLR